MSGINQKTKLQVETLTVERVCRRCGFRRVIYREKSDPNQPFYGHYPALSCPKCGRPGFNAEVIVTQTALKG